MSQPSTRNASTRSPIGRSCMRGTPAIRYSPPHIARTAVSGRTAVPALPRNRAAARSGNAPAAPSTLHTPSLPSIVTPSARSASSMRVVSSASSRPVSVVSPSASAGEQQRAVGNALRAGQRHDALHARDRARSRVAALPVFIGVSVVLRARDGTHASRRIAPAPACARGTREHACRAPPGRRAGSTA